ncbi:DNA polymerase III subunit alpha [Phyllobacterium myrsinacearum]|uniref:DNA polymerase III subunit alpha n=1 Tax=Phyllobacterium myrsinacearum TaxID=28101 RepID=A0A839ESK0_9HYPH|nr:DNA polymerase III subunit alpha [Phyllobacterium myrsinacearum]MBA8881772.1 DNA polymerase-3 subunit alpha [Phyllobacterium myrsinacearum]
MHSILAARTDFSIGESIISPSSLVEKAKELGARAVGITDTMSLTGLVDFTTRAKKAEIKPIIGVRLRMTDGPEWRPDKGQKKKDMPPYYYLTAYFLTEAGLKGLYRLLSLANSESRFYYESKLGFEDLYTELDNLEKGDIALTLGDAHGVITHPQVADIVTELAHRVGFENVYASLIAVDTPYFTRINQLSLEAIGHGCQPLTVRPAYYFEGEADALDIMGAVANNVKITDGWFKSMDNRDFHVVGDVEMKKHVLSAAKRVSARGSLGVGPAFSQGLLNTDKLAERVSYVWEKQPVSLPQMAPNEFLAVVEQCKLGWKERFSDAVFGHLPEKTDLAGVYKERLSYELSVLKKLNFSGYFLLVQDVVNYAKSNGILVGPGRGSVGGSLVAYLMGITDCDPIRFGLLFERFINPDRIDLPDADLDFMSERRHEVVEYLIKKYGQARVAGVSNFGTLAAASSIRDIGKAVGLSERDTKCSKAVPKLHGANVSLANCALQVEEIQEFAEKYEDNWWPIMCRLEETTRSYGQHAAGIIVGGVDLTDRAVIEKRKEMSVVCWDKRIVEDQGLVKMDLLGLKTLDLINLTLNYIKERHSKRVNINRIPLDDAEVLNNFAKGLTIGIFQFEGGGMRRLLKELGSDGTITFDDITAATALYRPGPMESGMMDSFYKRKQGREYIEYDHPLMEPILEPTFGVMVYQEQVMQVARAVAGYSAPDADKLRKIMGKKLPEEMAKERGKFVDGCVATIGADEMWAGQLFDKIEGFAGYGFNKSHSVEYTLISYQSMYLKTHYPVEFFAAALTGMDEDKLPGIIADAARFGIDVSMPDINISTDRFEIATDVRLVIPFQRIKGVAGTTTQAIIEARKAGPFTNKADFLDRVEKRRCNVKHQDALERVGAFSRIEPGSVPATDPSRVRDLIELIPGLITANVPVHRDLTRDKHAKEDIVEVIQEYRAKHGPSTGDSDGLPVKPHFGKDATFMIITDCPTRGEEELGSMSQGAQVQAVIDAMFVHDFKRPDIYWTGLIKRPKADKQVSSDEIAKYIDYLKREIQILEPPVIVLLGTTTVRHFLPDLKGKASDQAGKVVYSKEFDANLVIGFNPGELYYAPEKSVLLEDVFQSVFNLLN